MAAGQVAPNPMVGAVLVHGDRIIGEGYHQVYGGPHAEVNCLAAVQPEDRHLIPGSTLYVSLEPCAHFGKTPPCADLIIRERIPAVVVACRDPFPEVDGKGLEKLRAAGVQVSLGMLESEARELNKRFFTFHTKQRPYIILKWAQSADGKLAGPIPGPMAISNAYSNRLVHKWRSEEASILVGANTALYDNPQLTTRGWPGKNPVRLVLDPQLRLPGHLHLFNQQTPTIVFNTRLQQEQENLLYYQLTAAANLAPQVVQALYQLKLQSVLVEGGPRLLQSFIDAGYWDELRVITNDSLVVGAGLPAPELPHAFLKTTEQWLTDRIQTYYPEQKHQQALL